jgi:glycosyltransferase involved in cell wall biosynthesis
MIKYLYWETETFRVFKNWVCDDCQNSCRCLNKESLVEVLIPTFRHQGKIARAITSVLTQSLSPGEMSIFVHDDHSADSSVAEALSLLEASNVPFTLLERKTNSFQDSRFKFFFECVEASKARYLAFLDGDDYWIEAKKLEKQIAIMEKDQRVALCHTAFLVENAEYIRVQPDPSLAASLLQSRSHLLKENFIGTLTAVIRVPAHKFELPASATGSLAVADYPIWLCVSSQEGSKIAFLPDVTAAYVIHSGNYWATGSLISKLLRTRAIQRDISQLVGVQVGEPTIKFLVRTAARRIVHSALSHFGFTYGWQSRDNFRP